ncbi:hypothetical protein KTT_47370 [Tengunoibacter tsumagoiensis]|uniref:Carrier domain-containing protein n=1 Tax=Tengunoibacter tsumagoiensis TaxID=2014871 RepID=A0A402A6Y6_9CHLR|nr:hypothetical protein KTT_47370 [Tengunoibacter tsumagoiensis]
MSYDELAFSLEQEALFLQLLEEEGMKVEQQTIPLRKNTDPIPLSFTQQRLWFLDQLEPGLALYNMPVAVRLKGSISVSALAQALNEMKRRHDILRTTFTLTEQQALQIIHPYEPAILPLIDLQGLLEGERDMQASRCATEEFQRPFDLTQGPLLRSLVLRLDQNEHVLLLTIHHIISDAWSQGILMSELTTLYAAFEQGQPSPLPDLPLQYADYSVWQRGWLQKEVIEKDLLYWKEQLQGLSDTLELPLDYPRPPIQTFRGGSEHVEISLSLLTGLKQLGQQEDATLFMLLLAAFQILLARYSHQDDIAVGAAIANRTVPELENLLGFFANTLVLRTRLSDVLSYRDAINHTRRVALDAYEHQDVPFEQIVEALQPERSLSHNPLFQVMFTLQNVPFANLDLSDLVWQPLAIENNTAKFDLTLTLVETDQGVVGNLEYNRDLFKASTIHSMLEHFKWLLERLLANPDGNIWNLPLVLPAEAEQMLVQWNETARPYPHEATVPQLFAEQAALRPDAIALVCGQDQISYGELERRANQLAHCLQTLGVGTEVGVGLHVPRGLSQLIALLAIMKAGGHYVPLDPQAPLERLRFQLGQAGVNLLLTDPGLPQLEGAWRSLDLNQLLHESTHLSSEPPQQQAQAQTLAYILFTSGSTGEPKGVAVPHQAIIRLISQNWFAQLDHEQIGLQLAPLAFDASTLELWGSLLHGARLVLLTEQLPALERLAQVVQEQGVSWLWLTAGLFQQVVEYQPEALAGVRQVLAGGDVLGPEPVRALLRAHPGQQVINGYGPTENTTFTCCYPLDNPEQVEAAIPIGRPINQSTVYVLDRHRQPVPIGVIGELYTGGHGLARGYVGRSELTAERFVPHPFSATGGERLYRTGDLVRWRADGVLEYVGRADQQVKIRGYRIELGEIEQALRQQEALRDAIVLAREDAPGIKRLVAYLVVEEHATMDWDTIQASLQERLPEYMVPALHVVLQAFPLTPNGKVDRRALPAPEYAHLADAQSYVAPGNEQEQRLVAIWQQVLGVEQIGVHDNFFSLGGDSILSLQVVARARQQGLVLTPRQLFQSPTIAALAASLTPDSEQSVIEAEQGVVTGSVTLTPIQHWFFEQNQPDPQHWNQAMLLRTPAELSWPLLTETLQALQRQHDVLRLRFAPTPDGWQATHAEELLEVPACHVDLTTIPQEYRLRVMEACADQIQASLNLVHGPIWRAVSFHLGPQQEGRLLLVIHHLVVDGVSWRILLEDLQTAYDQGQRGASIQLPAKTTSWQQWASHLESYAQSEVVSEQLAYWQQQAALPVATLPIDHLEGKNTVASAQSVLIALSQAETQALLQEVPAAYRTQINDVLLTALAQALQQWTGQNNHRINLEGHGREDLFADVDLSRTVGWFTSIYPLVLSLPNDPQDLATALKAIKEQVRAIPSNGIGYGLARYLRSDKDGLREEIAPQISFNYLGQFDQTLAQTALFVPAQESPGMLVSPWGHREHLIEITGSISGGQLRLVWTYSQQVYEQETIDKLAQHYLKALQSLIVHCQSPSAGGYTPSDFPLASLKQSQVDLIYSTYKQIEAIYPLSPLQQGLLFQSLYAPGEGDYITQAQFSFQGSLNCAAFQRAWEQVVDRYSILRTAFLSDLVDDPQQLVLTHVLVPFKLEDWRDVPTDEQERRLNAYLQRDRQQGFVLDHAPLMRLTLIQLEDERYDLLWTHHHLLLDGWSLPLVLQAVGQAYEALVTDRPLRWPAVRPYQDYIAWLARQDQQAAERFWRQSLATLEPAAPLILREPPHPDEITLRRAEHNLLLGFEQTQSLQQSARQQQLTLNTLLLGSWGWLLATLSGQEQIVLGTTLAGRPPEISGNEEMVGLFINTLPLPLHIDGKQTLNTWLQQVQQQQSAMRQYEFTPLQQVQNWSPFPGGQALFETLFVFENYPLPVTAASPSSVQINTARTQEQTPYPLTCVVMPGEQVQLRLLYDQTRFSPETIELLLSRYHQLLTSLPDVLERPIANLTALLDSERTVLLEQWSQQNTPTPRESTVPQLFTEQAAQRPDAIALVCEQDQISYGELERQANQLAHRLQALGVATEVGVGLHVPRGLSQLIALLAILKAGGYYVPLDPQAPLERLRFQLGQAGVRLLLTDPDLPQLEGAWRSLDLSQLLRESEHLSSQPPQQRAQAQTLAYILFTSGSTGEPKGVAVPHHAIIRLVSQNWFAQLDHEQIGLQLAPLAFDASTLELWGSLLQGARLVLLTEQLPALERLAQVVQEQGVSWLWLTAGLFQQVVEYQPEALAGVRQVLAGGDVLGPEPVRALLRAHPGQQVINGYGPTENTTFTCCYPMDDPEQVEAAIPIGRPINQSTVYVLDRHRQPVPIGVIGELYTGGHGLARGYVGRSELTAERFVPHPFSATGGERLYRTGDLVRWRAEGVLEYVGRADQQVKIRGYRIELGEIEQALRQQEAVRDAMVLAREDAPGIKRLVAYLILDEHATLDWDTIQASLQERLPEYMVPALHVVVEAFPLTPNGKIDRRALPAPEYAHLADTQSYVAPGNEQEQRLVAIWQQVLGVEQIGVHDNFFSLGGDSILSLQVVARARQQGLVLTPRQLFQSPTIAALAASLTPDSERSVIEAEQGIVTGSVWLTPIQHWFFEQNQPDPQHWNQAMLLRTPAELSWPVLKQALQALQHQHDVLRLRFASTPDGWQATHAEELLEVPVCHVDLTTIPQEHRLRVIEVCADQIQASLDLTHGPIWRAVSFHLGPQQEGRLLLVIHHLVVDGVSWRILLEDLQTAYQQGQRGASIQLPAKTTSWQQWSRHLESHAQSEVVSEQLTYWQQQATLPVALLPVDHSGGENTVASAQSVLISLNQAETQALLQEVPAAYRTQINDVLLTALAQALQQWTGQSTHRIHLEGHGREDLFADVDLSRTVGWFTSIYPLVLSLPQDPQDSATALKAIKEQVRAIPSNGIGYGLARYLRSDKDGLREEIAPQISFNYLGQFDQTLNQTALFVPAQEPSGLAISPRGHREHLIEINGSISGGQLHLIWTYSQQVHEQETINRLAQHYLQALQALIAHCQSPAAGGYTPSDFPLVKLSQAQLDAILSSDQGGIEAIYPLSPLQQGLLFQSLYAPGEGDYIIQVRLTLRGELRTGTFIDAWQQVMKRHAILRTGFVWEEVVQPLQVVHQHVSLPYEQHDWSALSLDERTERLQLYLRADRIQGFDLTQAPLMRLTIVRTDEDSHEIVWTHHHLLLDGWSLPVLLQEIFALYEASVANRRLTLRDVTSNQDYMAWLARQDMRSAEQFWRQNLAGFSAPTQLDLERPSGHSSTIEDRHGMHYLALPKELTSALQEMARQQHLTLNTLVLGAWALLLSRYSDHDDIVVGSTVSGRPAELSGVETMVGLFINTLPVRVKLPAGQPLRSWLRGLQEQQSELRQYEYTPLAQVQSWSELPRGQQLFESLLVFENYPIDSSMLSKEVQGGQASLQLQTMNVKEQSAQPLMLVCTPGQQLSLQLMYQRTHFSDLAVEQMLRHLQTLLTAMAAQPDVSLARIAMQPPQALSTWTQSIPVTGGLHDRFERQQQQTPDAIALVFEDQQLTYRELNQRANQLAHHLRGLGVGPDGLVGLAVERSLEMLVGILGILKAGGAYVPLDPSYPQERLAFLMADAQIQVLLTQDPVLARLPEYTGPTLCMDRDWPLISHQSESTPQVLSDEGHLAYIIYTSGSTGRPKGVLVNHSNVLRLFESMPEPIHFSSSDAWTLFHSYAFDFSVWEMWGALLNGGRLEVVPFWVSRSPDSFHLLLCEKGITVLNQTPSAFRQLQAIDELQETSPNFALRYVIFGGEALELASLSPWVQRHGDAQPLLVNMYGITETTVHVTTRILRRSDIESAPGSLIGTPLADLKLYVLDRHYHPVPAGVTGELYVGGSGLARGYLNRTELTSERFIPNPYGQLGERLYKTGDLARYRADGELEYRGRADEQVKVRGFRIELGEIESVLAQHPQVREGVVVFRQAANGVKRLVAYIVPIAQAPAETLVADVRSYMQQRLPDYMLPAVLVTLQHMPLTPNGKIDRRALPEPEQRSTGTDEQQLPQTEIEKRLALVWRQVLGIGQVGIHENFFTLGGDSILSIQVVSLARQEGIYLTPRQLFQHPTISELATVVGTIVKVEAEQGIVTGELPLTPIQQWFFEQEQPDPHHWNQAMLLTSSHALDPAILRLAVAELLRHHDVLRLRFEHQDGNWRQRNSGLSSAIPFQILDLSAVPVAEREQAIATKATEVQASLDLTHGPVLRVAYLQFAAHEPGRLLIAIHHLAVDGVSWRILLEDLQTAYQQILQGNETVQLPPKTTSYQQWAQQLQSYAQTDRVRQELSHWQRQAEKQTTSLPRDHAQGSNTIASTQTISLSLSEQETSALLHQVPQAYHTQINDVLLTAFALAFIRWTGQRAITVHLEGHGREEIIEGIDLSRTVGWFTSIYPVRLEPGTEAQPIEALKAIKEQLRQIPRHGIGYGLLRYLNGAIQGSEQVQSMVEAEVSFNYLGQFDQVLHTDSLLQPATESSGSAVSTRGYRTHLVDMNSSIYGGRLQLIWSYSQNIHRQETIQALAQDYLQLLQKLISLCLAPEAGGYTPSDFPEAEVNQKDLDKLLNRLGQKKKRQK